MRALLLILLAWGLGYWRVTRRPQRTDYLESTLEDIEHMWD